MRQRGVPQRALSGACLSLQAASRISADLSGGGALRSERGVMLMHVPEREEVI